MLARSLFAIQFVENIDGPKGDDPLSMLGLCGMDPARMRESNADFAVMDAPLFDRPIPNEIEELVGLKGLVDGVGRVDDLEDPGAAEPDAILPIGGNADEGAVPARLLRKLEARCGPSVSLLMSGKVSSPGDSGMVSRRGVLNPLDSGGPQTGREPSACNSRALQRH